MEQNASGTPETKPKDTKPPEPKRPRPRMTSPTLVFVLIAILMLGSWIAIDRARTRSAIPYGFFIEQLEAGNIAAVDIDGYDISGRFVDPPLIPPPTEAKAVTIPTIGYGRFVEELREGNVAEAHSDGRELVGKFKKLGKKPAAAPKPTASAAGTATAAAPATTPEPDRDFRVLLGVHAGKELEDELVKTLGANYSVETSLEKYLVTREPLPGSLAGKPERFNKEFTTILSPLAGDELDQLLRKKLGEHYNAQRMTDSGGLMMFYSFGLTLLLIAGMFFIFRRARDQFMGGGFLSGFNKSPAKRYEATGKRTTFADVAGLEGVKNELTEIVEFLKNPQKFQRLGGRIPKGVLLEGPPGTGKTLLAKAVAGEAGVPFFSINGSEFIQMFVGVGAGRVRDMFRTAKEASPCILFIDEIDAVGRVRGTGIGGGQDEREQTLNQILSEMDGFSPNESVIVLAATNRADVLDPALLRPGRFDRRVTVDRPTVKGRIAIFKVHTREVPLADNVDLERLAQGTVGLTGADIRNLVNEAAIWATRQGKDRVDMQDFEYAYDKILMGIKREEVLSPHEKAMTAYHEAGHTILAWMLPGNDRVHKVTIIPRGRAMGVTQLIPEEDKLSYGESELHARLICLMGGRAAEKLVFDEYSVGAENDLKRATQLARRMVANWGMSERLGPIAFRIGEEHPFLGREMTEQREFSEHTAQVIDEETARILHAASDRAKSLLVEHREKLDQLSRELEQKETLEVKEIEAILGPPAQKAPPSLEHTPLKN